MHLSRYLKQYPCRDNPDRVLLFSTRRLSKAIVPLSVLRSLEEGTLSPESIATLTRLGFLVPDSDAERQEMLTVMTDAEERHEEGLPHGGHEPGLQPGLHVLL